MGCRLIVAGMIMLFGISVNGFISYYANDCYGADFKVNFEGGPEICDNAYDLIHRKCSEGWKVPEFSLDFFNSHYNECPKIQFKSAQKGKFYTLLMLDPDAPSPLNPKFGDWIHWGVVNIPGKGFGSTLRTELGKTFVEYEAPSPPPGCGKHRYNVILLEQNEPIDGIENISDRKRFDLSAFEIKWFLKEIYRSTFVTEHQNNI